MLKKTLAVVVGLVCGPVFFWVVEPAVLGQRPTPLFDREASIFFLFKLFPFLIVPAVCLIIATFCPRSRNEAFGLGAIFASSMLLPVPILDEWRTIPSLYGLGAFSWQVLIQVALVAGFLIVLAATVAGIAWFVSPLICKPFLHRESPAYPSDLVSLR